MYDDVSDQSAPQILNLNSKQGGRWNISTKGKENRVA